MTEEYNDPPRRQFNPPTLSLKGGTDLGANRVLDVLLADGISVRGEDADSGGDFVVSDTGFRTPQRLAGRFWLDLDKVAARVRGNQVIPIGGVGRRPPYSPRLPDPELFQSFPVSSPVRAQGFGFNVPAVATVTKVDIRVCAPVVNERDPFADVDLRQLRCGILGDPGWFPLDIVEVTWDGDEVLVVTRDFPPGMPGNKSYVPTRIYFRTYTGGPVNDADFGFFSPAVHGVDHLIRSGVYDWPASPTNDDFDINGDQFGETDVIATGKFISNRRRYFDVEVGLSFGGRFHPDYLNFGGNSKILSFTPRKVLVRIFNP